MIKYRLHDFGESEEYFDLHPRTTIDDAIYVAEGIMRRWWSDQLEPGETAAADLDQLDADGDVVTWRRVEITI